MLQDQKARLLFATALLGLSAACATAPGRDVGASFAAHGVGKPIQMLPTMPEGAPPSVGPYQLLHEDGTPANQLILGKDQKPLWSASRETKTERRSAEVKNVVYSMTVELKHAKTATLAYSASLETLINYHLVGTIKGPGGELSIDTFPEDFEVDGTAQGVNGGYVLRDGKVLAAFDWANLPEKILIADGIPQYEQEMLTTLLSIFWLHRVEMDQTGRRGPRNPPLGKLVPLPGK